MQQYLFILLYTLLLKYVESCYTFFKEYKIRQRIRILVNYISHGDLPPWRLRSDQSVSPSKTAGTPQWGKSH